MLWQGKMRENRVACKHVRNLDTLPVPRAHIVHARHHLKAHTHGTHTARWKKKRHTCVAREPWTPPYWERGEDLCGVVCEGGKKRQVSVLAQRSSDTQTARHRLNHRKTSNMITPACPPLTWKKLAARPCSWPWQQGRRRCLPPRRPRQAGAWQGRAASWLVAVLRV